MSPRSKYLPVAAVCLVLAVIGALLLPYVVNPAPHSTTVFVLGVYAAVFLFYGFVLFITFSWIKSDCQARGCSPVLPLCLLVLIPFPLGLLVWLTFRPALQRRSWRVMLREDTKGAKFGRNPDSANHFGP